MNPPKSNDGLAHRLPDFLGAAKPKVSTRGGFLPRLSFLTFWLPLPLSSALAAAKLLKQPWRRVKLVRSALPDKEAKGAEREGSCTSSGQGRAWQR